MNNILINITNIFFQIILHSIFEPVIPYSFKMEYVPFLFNINNIKKAGSLAALTSQDIASPTFRIRNYHVLGP